MDFILVWRVCRRSGNTVRSVIGILEDLGPQIQDFRIAGSHVVVLWKGVARMIHAFQLVTGASVYCLEMLHPLMSCAIRSNDRAVNNAVSDCATFLNGCRVQIAPALVHGIVASGIDVCCGVTIARFDTGTVVACSARISV
jgi:hypothetical protein